MKTQAIILASLIAINSFNIMATEREEENNNIKRLTPTTEEYYLLNYNVGSDKIAIQGYSPVSYIENGAAEKGLKEFKVTHDNITYLLTSQNQVDLFKGNPNNYLPQYGGYCAYGIGHGKKLDTDPESFKVINGKTYLFLKNEKVNALNLWNKYNHEDKKIAVADSQWEVLKLLL